MGRSLVALRAGDSAVTLCGMTKWAVLVGIVGCSAAPNGDPASGAQPQALTTEIVCQIGPVDQQDPRAGNSACGQYPWQWSDSAGNYANCVDSPCAAGDACHVMGGVFGQVVNGECAAPEGAKSCDSTSPWVWIGPNGPTSCLKSPPNGAQCWQTVNGTCRQVTIN